VHGIGGRQVIRKIVLFYLAVITLDALTREALERAYQSGYEAGCEQARHSLQLLLTAMPDYKEPPTDNTN
jgi:hypothetical protein